MYTYTVRGPDGETVSAAGNLTRAQLVNRLEQLVAQLQNEHLGKMLLCPLCQAAMSPRQSKFGIFYGCTAWPKTKCPGKRNAHGQPTAETKKLVEAAQHKKKKTKQPDVPSDLEQLDTLDLE